MNDGGNNQQFSNVTKGVALIVKEEENWRQINIFHTHVRR